MTAEPTDEERLIELVSWLEIAGQRGDFRKNFADFINGHRKSCRKTGYDYSRVATEGIVQICFWFPLPELEKICPIHDKSKLLDWLSVISTEDIEATLVNDVRMGECVLVKRFHYIPRDQRVVEPD